MAIVVGMALFGLSQCVADAWGQQRAPVRDADQIIQRNECSWKEIHNRNIVMQQRDYSCGAAALATVMRYCWGDDVGEKDVMRVIDRLLTAEELKDRVENGLSMSDLRRAAVEMGYLAQVGTVTMTDLSKSKVPLVVAIKPEGYDHFVVVRGIFCGRVYLADPIRGNIRPTVPVFNCEWQKNAALVIIKPNQKPPAISCLTVMENEVQLGWLNRQLIRRQLPPGAP